MKHFEICLQRGEALYKLNSFIHLNVHIIFMNSL